ncbi:MAG: alpha-ketoacid dehydrogenase subunit beta [Proteobacteria bacterium]|nr:alpha-ketoacid dehydrogenase subunit beta [Pseudomonadota bacterium]
MDENIRHLTYSQAVNEGIRQAMELSRDVVVMGQLVDYKPGVFGTTKGLKDTFGPDRVRDFPVAENIMTASAIGSSLTGIRPVIVHQRLDFMFYSFDQIVNWMSLWRFKSNGCTSLPVTILAIVGKGWGQAAQHSKSLHAWFAHLPGINVAIPATAYDAKGLMLESIFGENPTIIIANRGLFSQKNHVPEDPYRLRFGLSKVRRLGKDVTIIAAGATVPIVLRAAEILSKESIEAEIVDLRTLWPLDENVVCESVSKTKRLAVVDAGWRSFGMAGEIVSRVSEKIGTSLKSNPLRICLPDSHTPMSRVLEEKYYVNEDDVVRGIRGMFIK